VGLRHRLAILGLTDQHLHQRISQQSYVEQAQKLEILVRAILPTTVMVGL